MDGYTNCLSETNKWLKEQSQPVLKHEQLGKILTLPTKYNSFRAIFNRSIDSVVCSDDDKLVYLLRCTCGPAKDAINMCDLMEGRDGYQKAWDILKRRFVNVYLVANLIKGNLCSDKSVKSAFDLRNLADEAENASIILKRSKLYAELDTQHMISTIINRLSAHHKSKWRNTAVSMKDKVGTYPSFEHFVDFLRSISNEATYPVYGYDQIDVRRKNATNCSTNISERKSKCPLCNLKHKLYACSLFKQKHAIDRLDFVKSRNLCLVCFDKGHDR